MFRQLLQLPGGTLSCQCKVAWRNPFVYTRQNTNCLKYTGILHTVRNNSYICNAQRSIYKPTCLARITGMTLTHPATRGVQTGPEDVQSGGEDDQSWATIGKKLAIIWLSGAVSIGLVVFVDRSMNGEQIINFQNNLFTIIAVYYIFTYSFVC